MDDSELMFPDLEGARLEKAKFGKSQLAYIKFSQKQLNEIEILEEGDGNV